MNNHDDSSVDDQEHIEMLSFPHYYMNLVHCRLTSKRRAFMKASNYIAKTNQLEKKSNFTYFLRHVMAFDYFQSNHALYQWEM